MSATNLKIVDENTIGAHQRIILPRPSRKFVFDVIPGGSYASVGEEYTCVRHGAHQPQFPGCLLDAASRFIAQGSQRDLDVSCVQKIGAPAWPAATQHPRSPGG